jgi:hypothetical protein
LIPSVDGMDQIAAKTSVAISGEQDIEMRQPPGGATGISRARKTVIVSVGPKLTTVCHPRSDGAPVVRLMRHGPVALAASQALAASATVRAAARLMGVAAQQVTERAGLGELRGSVDDVLGSAGNASVLIKLAGDGRSRATLDELHIATETLVATWVASEKGSEAAQWSEPMMVGAAILAAVLEELGVGEISVEEEPSQSDGPLNVD